MKFYTITVLFAICTLQYALADWRADIEKERLNKIDSFIINQQKILMNNAMIHNTPGAWSCVNAATPQFMSLMTIHRPKVKQCVTSAANEDDANRCCDAVDYDIIAKVSVICNNAFSCIMQS